MSTCTALPLAARRAIVGVDPMPPSAEEPRRGVVALPQPRAAPPAEHVRAGIPPIPPTGVAQAAPPLVVDLLQPTNALVPQQAADTCIDITTYPPLSP